MTLATFEKALPLIAKSAPMLATMLGGPAAGTAVAILEKIFGVGNVEENILCDPDVEVKLKEAEASIKIAEINDIANARAREISGKHDWFLVVLAIVVIIGFFVADTLPLFMKIDASDRETVNHLQDTLGATFVVIISYYFGASHRERNRK